MKHKAFKSKKDSLLGVLRIFNFCLLLGITGICQSSCLPEEIEELLGRAQPKSDLVLADEALKARDIGDAVMYLERYLRKNSAGNERWEVWQSLLDISLNMRQDRATAKDYLEIMLVEYELDTEKKQRIQLRLAELCNEMRLYPRATALWEELVQEGELPEKAKADIYQELSEAYLRRLEISMSTQMLSMCLELKVPPTTKSECLYKLAETQMLTKDLVASENSLRDLLYMDEVAPYRKVLATFLLADVLEQQERLDEATRYYESIRDSYPNSRVVEMRLNNLRSQKIKPQDRPRR